MIHDILISKCNHFPISPKPGHLSQLIGSYIWLPVMLVLGLVLGIESQVLGLRLGLEGQVLGLGLGFAV